MGRGEVARVDKLDIEMKRKKRNDGIGKAVLYEKKSWLFLGRENRGVSVVPT